MTRQDFELIARVLRDRSLHLQESKRYVLAQRFADAFAEINPRFDRTKFIEAATKES
jgi:hypothetical protein